MTSARLAVDSPGNEPLEPVTWPLIKNWHSDAELRTTTWSHESGLNIVSEPDTDGENAVKCKALAPSLAWKWYILPVPSRVCTPIMNGVLNLLQSPSGIGTLDIPAVDTSALDRPCVLCWLKVSCLTTPAFESIGRKSWLSEPLRIQNDIVQSSHLPKLSNIGSCAKRI